jgi:glycerol-3-phosphate acyltransferase PlsY
VRILRALRTASVTDLAICSAMAFAASVWLDRTGGRGDAFATGTLLGLGAGLGFMALALWGRRRGLG